MYYNDSLKRINNINWKFEKVVISDDEFNLMKRFLHRMARFSIDNKITNKNPFFIDIAKVLGHEVIVDLKEVCRKETYSYLQTNIYIYLQ